MVFLILLFRVMTDLMERIAEEQTTAEQGHNGHQDDGGAQGDGHGHGHTSTQNGHSDSNDGGGEASSSAGGAGDYTSEQLAGIKRY